ncbi:MAG: hypothetical protein ACTHJQ_00250 [Rhizobiaceae bacterium]
MVDTLEEEYADTLEVEGDTKSSARVLSAIKKAERALNDWQGLCDRIDDIYSKKECYSEDWVDPDYDLFWASMEIMKPATYCYPPQPVVSPQFKDRRKLQNTTADILERSVKSAFDRTGIDEGMLCTRDDLIFYNRGQMWVTYETDEKGGGQRVCVEHLDRKDFLHPPVRKWSELPWVARRAWMTKTEMRKRFRKNSGDAYQAATFKTPTQRDDDGGTDHSRKTGVWEVWHKADNRVYWVAEGVNVMLDEGAPHLKLRGFFPCPKPAYGTLRPRTLIPTPDYLRYAGHFKKINSLTKRIYALLDMIRMKGLIPAGGDIGNAVEQVLADDDNASLLIPVPAAALIQGSNGNFVQWLPLADIATAIQGLIEARRELFSDYDRLSGISDIMRGETQAEETLGAQQLKSQYGSVRVREKIDELQRIARDVTQIVAEIMAENFSKETLLEMSQMEIPTKAGISRKIEEIEKSAKEDMKGLGEKARKAAEQAKGSGQQVDPSQAQQQLQAAQQQIVAKYGPMLQQASEQVPIEDVMKLLRDDKARGFAFEIATDSTILTDELQEKASRAEMLNAFTDAMNKLMPLFALGPEAMKLAGEMLKFALQPYRVGRDLNSVIDDLVERAPDIAKQMQQQQGQGGDEGAQQAIAEANQKLAEAEQVKAQASMVSAQAKAQQAQAESERKIAELQQKGAIEADKHARESEKLQQQLRDMMGRETLMQAQVDNLTANTAKILASIGLDERKQQLSEYTAANQAQAQRVDQAMGMQDRQQKAVDSERDAAFRAQDGERADRQNNFAERQALRESADSAK